MNISGNASVGAGDFFDLKQVTPPCLVPRRHPGGLPYPVNIYVWDHVEKMQGDGTEVRHRKLQCPIRRYYISVMLCVGYILAYSTRVNLSVAILFMTEKREESKNGTVITERDFNWDESLQGYALASFFYGYIVTQIPGGWLAGVIGGPHVLLIGIVGSGLLTFVAPVAAVNSYAALICVRVGCGLLQGLIIPAANSIWAKWSPPLERTILSGIGISGNFLSPLIVMPICGIIGDKWGWEWMFYFFGIMSCLWGFLWFLTVPDSPDRDKCITEGELVYIRDSIGERSNVRPVHPWGRIFRSVPVWAIIIAHIGHNWAFYTILLYGPKFFKETEGYVVELAAIFAGSGYTLCGILIQVFSQISDLIRSKGLLTTKTVRKMFTGLGFLIQASLMLLLSLTDIKQLTVALMILTLGLGGITWSGFYANPLDIATPHAAVIMGISNTFSTLPGIVSPYVTASLIPEESPTKSDWLWIWLICAFFYIIAGAFFVVFAEGEKQSWVFTPP